jgi:hypothetical protein
MNKKLFAAGKKAGTTGAALVLLMVGNGTGRTQVQSLAPSREKQTANDKFFCNINTLNPAERAHHKQLTEKLIASREGIVETEKGYEFQFSPSRVSLTELADWVAAEGKCCPFFDFHIDLEREGTLVCLRLTGQEGIKAFIRTEFRVPGK